MTEQEKLPEGWKMEKITEGDVLYIGTVDPKTQEKMPPQRVKKGILRTIVDDIKWSLENGI